LRSNKHLLIHGGHLAEVCLDRSALTLNPESIHVGNHAIGLFRDDVIGMNLRLVCFSTLPAAHVILVRRFCLTTRFCNAIQSIYY
jgi:hypothetical protein